MLRAKLQSLKKAPRGSALVLTMIFVTIFALVIAAVLTDVQQQTRNVHRTRVMTNTMEAAKSSVRGMVNNVRELAFTRPPQLNGSIGNLNTVIKSVQPVIPSGSKHVMHSSKPLTYLRDLGPNDGEYRVITDQNDEFYGYSILRLDYEMVSFLQEDTRKNEILGFRGMGARSRVTVNYIPLYQYAIFYNNELEIFPGPALRVKGKVHTNEDLYLTGNTVYENTVTSAGRILQFRDIRATTKKDGNVRIWDAKKVEQPTKPDNNPSDVGDWLDHEDPNWRDDAIARWNNNVLDKAHGVGVIRPPLPSGVGTQDMIARVKATDPIEVKRIKFEAKSDLVISGDPGNLASTLKIRIQTFNESGDVVSTSNVTGNPAFGGQSLVTTGEFYDGQQLTVVRTLDINMNVLTNLVKNNSIPGLNFTNGSGAIYISTTPGVGDTYTLALQNRDPEYQLDSKGNPLIFLGTSPTVAQRGFPVLVSGGNLGWVAGPTESQYWGNSGTNVTPVMQDTAYMPAVRIIRGEEVPANIQKGFGIYTDRPIYLVGNLNTTNKKTLVVGADAITVTRHKLELAQRRTAPSAWNNPRWATLDASGAAISGTNPDGTTRGFSIYMGNDWTNAWYSWDGARRQGADTVTHNAIFLMGNTPTVYDLQGRSQELSGGAHNVMRYLETWGTHNFNGSMIVLFGSRVAFRPWRDDGYAAAKNHRTPPTRNYFWDPALKEAVPPPGMPIVISVSTYGLDPISWEYAMSNRP